MFVPDRRLQIGTEFRIGDVLRSADRKWRVGRDPVDELPDERVEFCSGANVINESVALRLFGRDALTRYHQFLGVTQADLRDGSLDAPVGREDPGS